MIDLKGKDFLSTRNLSKNDLDHIIAIAEEMIPIASKEKSSELLKGKVLAALFYEPSTRTRLSFETAMLRLGGQVISVSGTQTSSIAKGETIYDTGKTVSSLADVIAVRHAYNGSAQEMADGADIPVLNGGDGTWEHPTQALLDLLTIKREKGKVDGLKIALVGDLKNGRTVHSLSFILSHYDVELILASPEVLQMPEEVIDYLKANNVKFSITESLEEAIRGSDLLYMTRVQKERFLEEEEYEKYRDYFVLTKELIEQNNPQITILHPLPRIGEITTDVDSLPGAAYFRQVANGVAMRMALLAMVLGKIN